MVPKAFGTFAVPITIGKRSPVKLLKFFLQVGGLAQLARAFAWHAKGHRFDSGNLH